MLYNFDTAIKERCGYYNSFITTVFSSPFNNSVIADYLKSPTSLFVSQKAATVKRLQAVEAQSVLISIQV